ncbi:MAG TPA: HD domain-containing phosphohydrolase [Terriglobia bacterium]|nr:HD domain-containing phosphohydrolase [Terriglobia bacterium]
MIAQETSNPSPRLARVYSLSVSAIGTTIALFSLGQLVFQSVSLQWLILAALTVLTGSFTVRIPRIKARLSVSDTFVFASVLLFGPAAGTITVVLDALIISLRMSRPFRAPRRVIFNVSLLATSIWVAAQIFFFVSGLKPYSIEQAPLGRLLFPLFLFTLAFFLLNTWLVSVAIALEYEKPAYPVWRDNFLWLSVNYFGGASVAALLVAYTREIDFTTLGIIVPLLLISYLTYKMSMGRIEDANRHLLEVNKLYLSTIETLAMAIDAKDQITHGHIRRVQRLAVGLARAVGVKDETQIKAIEAAALLHDMGKLAIPEFILNKPGRLTSNEFDVMKQHAHIGAEILGSIQFPYPVVPIVRHHHEAWDGSGYPDNLKGVAIPLGARILSVVDCFDALTSDRPYRPKLSVEDATAILVQRRGSLYDPMIVDKFIEVQAELSELAESDDAEKEAIDTIATKLRIAQESTAGPPVEVDERVPLRALTLIKSIKSSPKGISTEDLGLIVSRQLGKLATFSAVALYGVTENGQAIKCLYADKQLADLIEEPEIPLGEKLSGWVAAHRTPIWNSDATLDLSSALATRTGLTLGSSVPLLDSDVLIGTLTLYCATGEEISVEQRLLIQSVAPMLATALSLSIAHDEIAAIDATGKSEREALYSVIDSLISSRSQWTDRHQTDRLAIVLVSWTDSFLDPSKQRAFQTVLQRAISTATNGSGHMLRLSAAEMLITAPFDVLVSAGLAPNSTKNLRQADIRVVEITNSLQLREALGLTIPPELQPTQGKPLVH